MGLFVLLLLIVNELLVLAVIAAIIKAIFGSNMLTRLLQVILVPIGMYYYFGLMAEANMGTFGDTIGLAILFGPVALLILGSIFNYIIGGNENETKPKKEQEKK